MNLPFANHEGILRVDPANSSGLVILGKIVLREKQTGRILYQGESKNGFDGCEVSGRTDHTIVRGALVIKAYDDDPQIHLPLILQKDNLFFETCICYVSNIDEDAERILKSNPQDSAKTRIKNISSRLLRTIK